MNIFLNFVEFFLLCYSLEDTGAADNSDEHIYSGKDCLVLRDKDYVNQLCAITK
jgi:hypothetical protein